MINGVTLVPVMVLMMKMASNPRIMAECRIRRKAQTGPHCAMRQYSERAAS